MKLNIAFWLKFSLLNLFIVALIGLLMRYKIGFEFPFLDQKHLQQSHSNFAFSGWISHTLMTLMIYFLEVRLPEFSPKKFKILLIANLICAYGMLLFFIVQGYGPFSIFFSAASIIVSGFFCYYFIKDLNKTEESLSKNWFKTALFFNIISSLGTLSLIYMILSKNFDQDIYLISTYYYLHFQYNGWFFFASMGLLFGLLNLKKTEHPFYDTSFRLFGLACIPAYFLSTLWLKLPLWLYAITVIAAFIQVFTWFKLVFILMKTKKDDLKNYSPILRYILLFAGFALSIKLVLQLGSTIPFVSKLAFGFRPIVIAYLHLIFLATFSLFLLFYIYSKKLFSIDKKTKMSLLLITIGIFLTELILGIQGIASLSYTLIPYVNEMLFGVSILLVSGIGFMVFFVIKKH